MKLYELRACWTEYYDCPDYGQSAICDTYETVALSIDDLSVLKSMADELRSEHKRCFSSDRSKKLRSLFSGYDDSIDYRFEIVDITDKLVSIEQR